MRSKGLGLLPLGRDEKEEEDLRSVRGMDRVIGFWVGWVGPREVDLRGLLFSFEEDDERDGSLREVVSGVMDLVVVVGLVAPSITAAPERRVDMVSERVRVRKKRGFFENWSEEKCLWEKERGRRDTCGLFCVSGKE